MPDTKLSALTNSPAGSAAEALQIQRLVAFRKVLATAAPASVGNHDSPVTAFDGDLSKIPIAIDHRISGAATLGQPAVAYQYVPEVYPHYTYLYNTSGHNEALDSNVGRTAAIAYHTKIYQSGQGDAAAYNASVFITSTKSGATHFLASPAGTLLNGSVNAGVAGCYLNPMEINLNDNGFDVAGVSYVSNLNRTIASSALSTYWAGIRLQSVGSVTVDDGFILSGAGGFKRGINFAYTTLSADNAAIVMKKTQRIYGNAVGASSHGMNGITLGTTYIEYAAANAWVMAVDNTATLQVYSTLLYSTQNIRTGGYYILADAVTAPTATAGQAKIYVDTADGDLKVIFGDGVIKTLAVDT